MASSNYNSSNSNSNKNLSNNNNNEQQQYKVHFHQSQADKKSDLLSNLDKIKVLFFKSYISLLVFTSTFKRGIKFGYSVRLFTA
jgi:hypothetical protein